MGLTAEFDSILKELDIILTELRETLNSINNFNHDDREHKLAKARRIIDSAHTAKQAAVLEARCIIDSMSKSEAEEALRKRMEVFKRLVDDHARKQTEIDRDQLQAEIDDTDATNGQPQLTQTQALAIKGDKLQDQTQQAVTNMAGMVGEAENIGVATAVKLDQQTEQMMAVERGLDDVQYNTQRARTTAAQMARGATHDRCIQCLCLSVVLTLIALIILVSI